MTSWNFEESPLSRMVNRAFAVLLIALICITGFSRPAFAESGIINVNASQNAKIIKIA